ncbi:BsuBI/PstI family type II restriction endonuclease [Anabaena sp. CCY 9402-a]|uniref:BsuBI/PstI family type II restriction endonuclease n=1 Tax=Anabaena sp. CCY 9402-a TaxID=3103867 RepID=UPI0039C6450E
MTRYLAEISWETEVWVADQPYHMIHFNGKDFLDSMKTEKIVFDDFVGNKEGTLSYLNTTNIYYTRFVIKLGF